MSTREDGERQRSCSSRGLGIAAAAIGAGVGAALYYYFNKRAEDPNVPDAEGATSSWTCEQPQALINSSVSEEEESYITISEHSTSDTSMHDTSSDTNTANTSYDTSVNPDINGNTDSSDTSISNSSDSTVSSTNSEMSVDSPRDSPFLVTPDRSSFMQSLSNEEQMDNLLQFLNHENVSNGLESDESTNEEFDVIYNGIDNHNGFWARSPLGVLEDNLPAWGSPRQERSVEEEERRAILREQAFRERSWSPEECSICFDVMLRDDIVMSLPCTHRFHQHCILPWLQERQTCPNCRKQAECLPDAQFASVPGGAPAPAEREELSPFPVATPLLGGFPWHNRWAWPPGAAEAFRRFQLDLEAIL